MRRDDHRAADHYQRLDGDQQHDEREVLEIEAAQE
jgi:hypothetical protein